MTPRDFCYWLQGLLEVGKPEKLDSEQLKIIENHLNLVFRHEIDGPDPTGELQATHDGKPAKPAQAFPPRPGGGLARC